MKEEFERVVDRKDAIIHSLARDIEEAEEQYVYSIHHYCIISIPICGNNEIFSFVIIIVIVIIIIIVIILKIPSCFEKSHTEYRRTPSLVIIIIIILMNYNYDYDVLIQSFSRRESTIWRKDSRKILTI